MIARNVNSLRFDPEHFGTVGELRASAGAGACPILMVSCSDHETAPDLVSLGGPDRLFVVQQVAAAIPASSDVGRPSVLASIEYAVAVLEVRHVIVCQHLGCGIISRWLRGEPQVPSSAEGRFEREVRQLVDASHPGITGRERTRLMVHEHTLSQIENLQTHECIQSRLRTGRIRLHGWVVDDETARVRQFDAVNGRFS